MAAILRGITDQIRAVLESSPGKLHAVGDVHQGLGNNAPESLQPIYNALHELTKTGEVRRIKKPEGKGSYYYWPKNPDEHQPADAEPVTAPPRRKPRQYNRTPSLAQAVNGMTAQPRTEKLAALTHQEGGSHYKDFAIQPIEFIQTNGIGFVEGNVIKYLCRWRNKNGIEDLKKARHYIDLLIEHEQNAESAKQ